MKDTNTQRV